MSLPSYNPPRDGRTEADAVAEITSLINAPQFPTGEVKTAVPLVLWPREGKVQNLEEFMATPIRKRAIVNVHDHPSFIEYVAAHKEAGTVIFAEINEQGGSFTAVIDFHLASNIENQPRARWRQHRCVYIASHTPEWKRWMALSGKAQSQSAMALFIEDNLYDISNPTAGRMLDMVKTLEATQGVEFKSAVRLETGDRSLHFVHNTVAKAGQQGEIEIPQKFTVTFPVFLNGPAYAIDCRFRYQIKDGVLTMAFEVERPHKIIEFALAEARAAIKTALNLPVLQGSANT